MGMQANPKCHAARTDPDGAALVGPTPVLGVYDKLPLAKDAPGVQQLCLTARHQHHRAPLSQRPHECPPGHLQQPPSGHLALNTPSSACSQQRDLAELRRRGDVVHSHNTHLCKLGWKCRLIGCPTAVGSFRRWPRETMMQLFNDATIRCWLRGWKAHPHCRPRYQGLQQQDTQFVFQMQSFDLHAALSRHQNRHHK